MAESKAKKEVEETREVTAACDQNCNPKLNDGKQRVKKDEKFIVLESKRKFLSVFTEDQMKAIKHNKDVLERVKGEGKKFVPRGSLKNINKIDR